MGCSTLRTPVKCLLKPIVGAVVGIVSDEDWEAFLENFLIQPRAPNQTSLVLWSEPDPGQWYGIWEATWIASGAPTMFVLSLFVLLVGFKFRETLAVWGVIQPGQGQQDANVKLGFLGAVLAYPVAIAGLMLANGLTEVLLPIASNGDPGFVQLMEAMVTTSVTSTAAITSPLEHPGELIGVLLTALGFVIWKLMLVAREVLVYFYVMMFPLLVAVRYTGFPVASDLAGGLLTRYVSVLLIPVIPAVLSRAYFLAFGAQAVSNMYLPAVFMILTVYLTWKMFSDAAPIASGAIKGGIGAGLAAGVLATGGSGFAAANMLRGRYLSGAIYATNPDFDYAPEEEDVRK